MEQELKITKEKVLEAASKCNTADGVLRTLFPEAFVPDDPVLMKGGMAHHFPSVIAHTNEGWAISFVQPAQTSGSVLELNKKFDWNVEWAFLEGENRLILKAKQKI